MMCNNKFKVGDRVVWTKEWFEKLANGHQHSVSSALMKQKYMTITGKNMGTWTIAEDGGTYSGEWWDYYVEPLPEELFVL